jgi:hypothetical protein
VFGELHSLDEILKEGEAQGIPIKDLPTISLLRCGIEEFGKVKEGESDAVKPRTEELFQVLEGKIPWLVSEDGLKFEVYLFDHFSVILMFTNDVHNRMSYGKPSQRVPSFKLPRLYLPLPPQTQPYPRAQHVGPIHPRLHKVHLLSSRP